MKVKTVKGLLAAGATLASVAAWGGEGVTNVTLAVDLRTSPRALANESDFLPITYDAGDWSDAASSADVTVSRNGAAARTLVGGATKAGALVFTAIGPGHYAFVHTANGETLTAEFDLAAGARADVAMGAPDATAIPAGTLQPRITAIRKVGDRAYLMVAGTVPYLQYNATKGDEPQAAQGGANAAEEPKNGVLGEDVILVVPAQGEKAFYGLKRN